LRGMETINIGTQNAEFATQYLNIEGINIVSKDLLGNCSRKVYFFPSSGRVLVKKIHTMHNETIREREKQYREKLRAADIQGDVELF